MALVSGPTRVVIFTSAFQHPFNWTSQSWSGRKRYRLCAVACQPDSCSQYRASSNSSLSVTVSTHVSNCLKSRAGTSVKTEGQVFSIRSRWARSYLAIPAQQCSTPITVKSFHPRRHTPTGEYHPRNPDGEVALGFSSLP